MNFCFLYYYFVCTVLDCIYAYLYDTLLYRTRYSLLRGYNDPPYWAYWRNLQQRLTGTGGDYSSGGSIHSVSDEYAQYLRDFQRQHANNPMKPHSSSSKEDYIDYGDLSVE